MRSLIQLLPVLRLLTHEAARTLVQAFISSCLDYCNSLLYGLPQKLIGKVQSVQNAAARLLTGTKRRDHISTVRRQLHWQDASTSTWHVSFTRLCPTRHLRTWLTTYTYTLGFRRSKTSAPLVHPQIVCCSTEAQHIWRQKLCCRRATSLE